MLPDWPIYFWGSISVRISDSLNYYDIYNGSYALSKARTFSDGKVMGTGHYIYTGHAIIWGFLLFCFAFELDKVDWSNWLFIHRVCL